VPTPLFLRDAWSTLGVFPRTLVFVTAALVIFLSCLIAPNRFQVLYWLNGSLTYTIPLVTLTALVLWSLKLTWQQKPPAYWVLLLFGFAGVISGGFSETTAVLQFSGFFMLLIYCVIYKRISRYLLVFGIGVAASLAAIILFLVSPGNHIRQALFPAPPGIFELVYLSTRYGLAFIYHTLIAYPVPILFGVFIACLMGILLSISLETEASPSGNHARSAWLTAGIIALSTLVLIICICAPSAYAQSAYPEARALLPAVYILLLGLISLAGLAGFQDRGEPDHRDPPAPGRQRHPRPVRRVIQ